MTVSPPAATALAWRTWELDTLPDLLAIGARPGRVLWQRHGCALAGSGCALRLVLPGGLADGAAVADAEDRLRSLAGDGPIPPLAVGALPYDRSSRAELVVPAVTVRSDGERAWLTVVGPDPGRSDPAAVLAEVTAGADARPAPDGFSLRTSMSHADFRRLVADTVAVIDRGELAKVVLARRVDVEANTPFVLPDVLSRMAALYPACTVFHAGGFVGASPELLVERRGTAVECLPLAGTVARSGDADADGLLVAALVESAKEQAEHRFVIDGLTAALRPACRALDVPGQPEVLALRNVSHLATRVRGRLAEPAPSALALAALVHPTPAVAGTPTDAAVAYQTRVEGFDRGRFAGPVGWFDANGDGSWALGLRCAVIDGPRAALYAGVGVVAGSDPSAELAETQLKLQAMLAALVRP